MSSFVLHRLGQIIEPEGRGDGFRQGFSKHFSESEYEDALSWAREVAVPDG